MAEMNDIVKIAVDAYHGKVEKYSVDQSMELLREALVKANGGSTTLNYKNMRDGKCNGLFALVEEILSRTVVEGLQQNDFFMALVDFRNVAEGDKNVFLVEDDNMFVVAEIAPGTQGIRRQRIGGYSEVSIPTHMYAVKIYEELNRVLAGRVDFNYFINKVSEAFTKDMLERVFALWNTASAEDFGGVTYFPAAGAYDEEELLELIAHVEAAANGKSATIMGTKKALRKLMPAIQGHEIQGDMYNQGYIGRFYGTPVVAIPQRHKMGSTEFVMDDDVLTIMAGDDKPIKVVYEGDPLVITGDPMNNGDLTYEYMYAERWGMGIILAGGANAGIGRYQLA